MTVSLKRPHSLLLSTNQPLPYFQGPPKRPRLSPVIPHLERWNNNFVPPFPQIPKQRCISSLPYIQNRPVIEEPICINEQFNDYSLKLPPVISPIDEFPLDRYQKVGYCGDGTFGKVYSACDLKTGQLVALKQIKMCGREGFPVTAIREINLLGRCKHENVLTIKETVWGKDQDYCYLVLPYLEYDLRKLIEKQNVRFSLSEIKNLMLQLLSGLEYLHKNKIIHRDLKTENILLDGNANLKICDLGLARTFSTEEPQPYTPVVVTLWYRCPELLLGPVDYSTEIDIWSVGCIFGELLRANVLFPGSTEIDQADKIFSVIGTPNDYIWPGFSSLPLVHTVQFKNYRNKLSQFFPPNIVSRCGFHLLQNMLTCPQRRVTTKQAIQHQFFREEPLPSEIRDLSLRLMSPQNFSPPKMG